MEDISINGEKYVKASLIARELGYTPDYVGQLCRGGKVDAQLVGRSWYVREESLREHKKDRYRSSAKKTKKALVKTVQESANKTAVKPEHNFPSQTTKVAQFPRPNYEADYHELLPKLSERKKEEDASSAHVVTPPELITNETTESTDTESTIEKEYTTSTNPAKSVPINVIGTQTPIKREQIADIQHKNAPNSEQPKEEVKKEEQPTEQKSNILVWILTISVALILAVAFIGLEAHIHAQQGSVSSTYVFDLGKVLQLPASLVK